jgi:hypothetical protein
MTLDPFEWWNYYDGPKTMSVSPGPSRISYQAKIGFNLTDPVSGTVRGIDLESDWKKSEKEAIRNVRKKLNDYL